MFFQGMQAAELGTLRHVGVQGLECRKGCQLLPSFRCCLQERVCSLYRRMLDAAVPSERKACQVAGLSLAYSQAAMFIVVAIVVYFGGAEVSSGRATFENMLKAFMSIVFASMGVAQAMVSFPEIGKAGPAVQRMMRLLYPDGSTVRAEYRSTAGGCVDSQQCQEGAADASEKSDLMHGRINDLHGRVQLVRVWFSYPTRPDVRVLQDFSLDIAAGAHGYQGCAQ